MSDRAAMDTKLENDMLVKFKGNSYGWFLLNKGAPLPKKVKASMASMTEDLRSKAAESDTLERAEKLAEDVFAFHMSDRAAMVTMLENDMSAQFKARKRLVGYPLP